MRKPRVEGRFSLYWGSVYRWWVWHPNGALHGNYRTWTAAMSVASQLAADTGRKQQEKKEMFENCHDYDPEVEKQLTRKQPKPLTAEEGAQRLELWAAHDEDGHKRNPGNSHLLENAALLRKAAALIRANEIPQWRGITANHFSAFHKGYDIHVFRSTRGDDSYVIEVSKDHTVCLYTDEPNLPKALQAAADWVNAEAERK